MKASLTVCGFLAAAFVALGASNASAQVLGPFSWQMQPFCNVVRLTLTSTPVGFTADGSEDQCGGASQASAVGLANFNAFGLVTINFTIVTAPSGKPVHVSAIISPANGSGTWTDSVGNSGPFVFGGAAPALPPRPLPASGVAPATITSIEIASSAVGASEIAAGAVGVSEIAAGAVRAGALGTITERSANSTAIATGTTGSVAVNCLAGEQFLTGGNGTSTLGPGFVVVASRQSGNGWRVFMRNDSGANQTITAHVYCLAP